MTEDEKREFIESVRAARERQLFGVDPTKLPTEFGGIVRLIDKRVRTVRFWGRCADGGLHEGVPCRKCAAQPTSP